MILIGIKVSVIIFLKIVYWVVFVMGMRYVVKVFFYFVFVWIRLIFVFRVTSNWVVFIECFFDVIDDECIIFR